MNGKSSGNVAQSKESRQATRKPGATKPDATKADSERHNAEEVGDVEEEAAADSSSTADDATGSDSGADMDKPIDVTATTGGTDAGRSDGAAASNPGDESPGSGGEPEAGAGAGSGTTGRGSSPAGIKAVRRAHLTLSRIEPWSVMKFSFIVSLVCFIILFVAVGVIYVILASLGVFDAVTDLITSLVEGGEAEEDAIGMNPETWFAPARVLGYAGLIGALNIILITALATVGAMVYNLAADLVGGLDITLSEIE